MPPPSDPERRSPPPASPMPDAPGSDSDERGVTAPLDAPPASAFPDAISAPAVDRLGHRGSDGERRVGRYVLSDELGRGGMGIVHRAFDPSLQREVAIKVLPATAGARAHERFLLEARAAARLHHPAIVSVHEVGLDDGRPFIVMDLVSGGTLESLLETSRLPPRRIAEIVREVALGLHHAHRSGIVHRDVKPQNVLLDGDQPRLADFGLAKAIDARDDLTASGAVVGTPSFSAPEQLRGEREIRPQADVYGLGALLYRAVTGSPPFSGETFVELVRRAIATDPIPPRQLDPRVHPDLETISLRCLEKEPERRYPTALDVADELGRFIDGEAIEARPLGRIGRIGRWVRRRRLVAATIAATALVIVGAAVSLPVVIERTRADATAEDRRSLIDQARAETSAAFAALDEARQASDLAAVDARLAASLDAWRAAERWRSLAPDDARARRHVFDAAMALGDEALAAEQWRLAASVFDEAAGLGVDSERAQASRRGVEEARDRRLAARRQEVDTILSDARSGKMASQPSGHEDAVFALARLAGPDTVSILGRTLDEVTAEVTAVRTELLLAAGTPDPSETSLGLTPIEGLAHAVRVEATRPGGVAGPDAAVSAPIAEAMRRLAIRDRRMQRTGNIEVAAPPRSAEEILADALERRLATPRDDALAVARLCSAALGRIGIRDGAVGPLGRYLRAEPDEARSLEPAIALCRVGTRRDIEDWLTPRFKAYRGRPGSFTRILTRHIERRGIELVLERPDGTIQPIGTNLQGPTVAIAAGPLYDIVAEAKARLDRGDHAEAIASYDRAVDLEPSYAPVWALRAYARLSAGDAQGALADLNQAISIDGGLAFAWAQRAETRRRLDDIEGAIADASRAIELAPDYPIAWCYRGIARRTAGDLPNAIADLERAAAGLPGHAVVLRELGAALVMAGELDRGLETLDRAIQAAPAVANAWSARSIAWRRKGDIPRALADLKRALQLAPEDASLWTNASVFLRDVGDPRQAVAAATRAIELAPRSAQARYERACGRRQLDDPRGALADVEEALRLSPRYASAFAVRATIRDGLGDREGALADFGRALELEPNHVVALNNRGGLRNQLGDHRGALEDFHRCLEVAPRDYDVWFNRARTRRALGDLAGAVEDFTRSFELNPRFLPALRDRAIARIELDQLDAARADLTELVDGGDGDALWIRANVARRLGDRSGEKADLERFVGAAPEADARLPEARARLAELR